MNDDQLRDRIGRSDPLGDASITPVTSPEARIVLEDIMNTPLEHQNPGRRTSRWLPIVGAAAAVVALVGVGAAVLDGDDEPEVAQTIDTTTPNDPTPDEPTTTEDSPTEPTQPAKAKVLDLTAAGDDLMASCLALDATILSQTQVAFKGTVTMAEGGVVQLTIDQAYKGTDAQVATLSAPEGMEALIGGVEWQVGDQYLISAWEGNVNYCGQSGPVTPELQAIYDEAFPAS